MKNILSIIGLAFVLSFFLMNAKSCQIDDYVSNTKFDSAHAYLNRRVDTVIYNQEQMQTKIDSILNELNHLKRNQEQIIYRLDTLQAGQILIYSEVTQQNKSQAKYNFFDYVIDILE